MIGMLVMPMGPSEPGSAPNQSLISPDARGALRSAPADGCGEFGFAQLMVAAQQRENGLAVRHHHEALHLRGLRADG